MPIAPDLMTTIRRVTSDDNEILWKFLSIAAHEDDMKVVKSHSDLIIYVDDFDAAGADVGVVAFDNQEAVGAAWVRFWNTTSSSDRRGYGHVRDGVPELAIGVSPDQQGKGVGTALLQRLFEEVEKEKIPGISLSVRDDNAALRLYQRLGFVAVDGTEVINRVGGRSFSMLKLLSENVNNNDSNENSNKKSKDDGNPSSGIVLRQTINKNDLPTLLMLLEQKAAFDKTMADNGIMSDFTVTVEKLQVILLDESPLAHVVLAESLSGDVVGMALYYYRFSSFQGQPSLWLEDLFVTPSSRSQGVGKALMDRLKAIAAAKNCTHIGWTDSNRNERGLAFYTKRLGAKVVSAVVAGDQLPSSKQTTTKGNDAAKSLVLKWIC